MKKFGLLLSLFFLMSMVGQAQSLDKLFKKYSDDNRFEYTSIGKGMLGIFSIFADYSEVTDGALQKITGLKVLKLDSDTSNTALLNAFTNDIEQVVRKGEFESTVEKRDKSSKTSVYRKVGNKLNADYIIVLNDYKGVTFVWMTGKASPDYD